MRRISSVLLASLIVGACSGSRNETPPPAASAMATVAVPSIGVPATVTPLPPTPVPIATTSPTAEATSSRCPVVSPMTIEAFGLGNEAGCFGREDLQVQGFVDAPPGIGFGPTWIEPKWLFFPVFEWALWTLPPGDGQDCGGKEPCNSMFVFVNPDSGVTFAGPPRWVIVTGHVNDPAAATCHYASDPPQEFTEADNASARESCAGRFVVTRVDDAP